jgi:hypothetical protein
MVIAINGNYQPMVQREDVNNAPYSNATTNTLTITSVTNNERFQISCSVEQNRKFMRFIQMKQH